MQKFAFFVNLLKNPYICSERNSGMEIIFNEAYLLEIYKTGLSSVRVNDRYRIEFEEHIKDGEAIATICNITDLSNHYK